MSAAKTVWAILAVAGFAGCQFNPHADLYTTSEPEVGDIPGTYVLDWFVLPPEASTNMPSVSIELRADGTFSATNVPPWDEDVGEGFVAALVSGEGRWEKNPMGILDSGEGAIWGVALKTLEQAEFRNRHAKTLANLKKGEVFRDFPKAKFSGAALTGQKPPYGLIFTLGDPDSGHVIVLKRTGD